MEVMRDAEFLLYKLSLLHQLVKLDYLEEAKKRRWPNLGLGNQWNNRNTLSFLHRAPAAREIGRLLDEFQRVLKGQKLEDCYWLLRWLYIVSPSLHELWFFESHFRVRTDNIIQGRLGLKTLLTACSLGNQSLWKAALTYVSKNVIMLENQYRGMGVCGLLEMEPAQDALNRSAELIQRYQQEKPGDQRQLLRSGFIEELLAVVHSLLRDEGFDSLISGNLATKEKWLFYAPCVINEGPLFIPKDDFPLAVLTDNLNVVNPGKTLLQCFILWDYLSEDKVSLASGEHIAAWRLRIQELLTSAGGFE